MKMETVFSIFSVVAGIIALFIMVQTYIKHPTESSFGERFTIEYLQWNTPIFNFHFKAITLFVIFSIIFWACGLEGIRSKLVKIPLLFKRSILIVSFVFIFVLFYEVFQVFVFWAATYAINLDKVGVDELHTDITPSGLVVDFTTMTKIYTLILFISIYTFYFFYTIGTLSSYNKKGIGVERI